MKLLACPCSVVLLAFFGSCDSDEPALHRTAAELDGKFRCLVNGQLFLPNAPWGYGSGVYADIQVTVDTVGIVIYAGNSSTHHNLIISLFDSPGLQVGKTYDLTNPRFYVQYVDNKSCWYADVSRGFIKLSKYVVLNNGLIFISGTFEFTASSDDCTDRVVVTNGRFNIDERL